MKILTPDWQKEAVKRSEEIYRHNECMPGAMNLFRILQSSWRHPKLNPLFWW